MLSAAPGRQRAARPLPCGLFHFKTQPLARGVFGFRLARTIIPDVAISARQIAWTSLRVSALANGRAWRPSLRYTSPCWRAEFHLIFGRIWAMKKTHHETTVRKLIMLGAGLTLLLGFPFALANRAFANPTPKFAYVTNQCDSSSDCAAGNVSAYTINSSMGALRAVAGSPFAAGSAPISVTVDPSGRFAYVAN